MEFLQGLNQLMENTRDIALATSVDNAPNVRIVNFYYDTQKPGIVYFTSFKGKPKELEFVQNNRVAFTTVPHENSNHVRVTKATVQKSNLAIYDLKSALAKKNPGFAEVIEQLGDKIDVYEIHFQEANVILGFNKQGKVTF